MSARFGHDAFSSIGMAAVDSCVRVCFCQPLAIGKEIVEPPAPCALLCTCGSLCTSTIFQIKDSYFRITSACHDGTIVRMGHKLDREDVGMMAGANARIECEGLRLVGRVVLPNVEVGIIGAGSE